MQNKLLLIVVIIILAVLGFFSWNSKGKAASESVGQMLTQVDDGEAQPNPYELSIKALRAKQYPGSEITIEETLAPGSNYQRYIASYKSEGLKIFALLTVPNGESPAGGWPTVVFNHGYIPPAQYRTTERYTAYTDAISRSGYVLFRSDYRGHGESEGQASGGYGSNGYTVDILNAVASIKRYPGVNGEKIGMWGHSMGGHITLRNMVVNKDVKAGVIWGGVVASYPDLISSWRRGSSFPSSSPSPSGARRWRQQLIEQFGSPEQNPEFWNSISATSYLADISGPTQLHHGVEDRSVPVEFSEKLAEQLKAAGREVELYTYAGDDHDITANFGVAIQRSVEFFDRYLKNSNP
ncbi:MAG: alpha/beta fold hydrolase [Candidatus Curtissbacteria bacterium]